MGKTRQDIMQMLGMNGGLTTGELSVMLGISATAVRRHLKALESEGTVHHRTEQRGMGRPSYIYEPMSSASDVFAQSYSAFVKAVLQDLSEPGGDRSLDELFDRRQEPRHRQYTTLTEGETLSDRVASLARLMENEGRIVTWEQPNENRFILREHNCPLYRLAQRFDHPCRCETSLLRETLKAKVKRVNHILEGDVACVYMIEDQVQGRNEYVGSFLYRSTHDRGPNELHSIETGLVG